MSLNPGQFIILGDKKSLIEDDENLLLSSEKPKNNKIKIYPNPYRENVYIEMDHSIKLPLKASLFNSNGSLVWEKKVYDHFYLLNSNLLSSGIYNLILSSNDFYSSKKIIKK